MKGEPISTKHTSLSRGDFLRVAAVGLGTLVGGRLLSACSPAPASATLPPATATAAVAATVTPTATVTRIPRPEVIRFFPSGLSRVVQTHHAGVWSDKTLVPGALRQMLDASITKLTGLNDAREAWASLFRPGERIAIKVNAFKNSALWTHAPLVQEVTNSLVEAGIPAGQITVFDYSTPELSTAGFSVNASNPGVLYTGTDKNYCVEPSVVMNKKVNLSNILKECDALINMPILKIHGMSGITFAMKNHYGSILFPSDLHSKDMHEVAALNTLTEIKDRTRLIIGDALSASLWGASSLPYWREDWIGDSIFMSFDPVAHDAMGLQLLSNALEKNGGNPAGMIGIATPVFRHAAELGLGTNDLASMEVMEQALV